VAVTSDRNLTAVQAVLARLNTSLPILLDSASEMTNAYRGYALPTLYLIDQQQRVYGVWIGSVEKNKEEVVGSIEFLVK